MKDNNKIIAVVLFVLILYILVVPIFKKKNIPNKPDIIPVVIPVPEPRPPAPNIIVINSYEDAMQASKLDGKPIVIAFTAAWCGPCQKMKKNTLSNKKVKEKLAKDFHYYLSDVDEERSLAKKYNISSMPTLIIANSNEQIISKKIGLQTVSEFLSWLDNNKK